ncbi:hypothetical protein CGZ90_20075 [Fictibacillus aquaticus]|uniref:YkoS n=1 Tax=Fictibacillus aquaticus TaxID=2021314 RepID=A0A235F3W6_9BACL|nr:hypothetical protein CGZ90_20075 [Fictibacillus aquaticus]
MRGLAAAALIVAIYLLPLFLLGENAHVRIHDNLDSNVGWYKVLKESGQIAGSLDAVIPQIINGLPRNAFGNEFNLLIWLHYFLPSMTAYAISQTIVRIAAFAGMYLLLKTHVLKGKDALWINIGTALCFAITPFWPSGMLSTLGQPLALWAFLNIRKGKNTWREWAVIILLPFYSSFVLGFFFFLAMVFLVWVYDLFRCRRVNVPFALSLFIMALLFVCIEYRLFLSLVLTEEASSRNEFLASKLELPRTIRLVFKNFLIGHNHVMTLHTLVILPVWVYAFWFIRKAESGLRRFFLLLMLFNFLLSVWYAFWFYKGWQPVKDEFSILKTFNFARFHFLRPLVIYVLFAVGLYILLKRQGIWRGFVYKCLILQILVLFAFNDEVVYRVWKQPSFKEFYSEPLFDKVKSYIGKPQQTYRVASVGLHPVIAQYNGFYTLDTYNNYYPLEYKHRFRKLIEGELSKNRQLRNYFDHWGGRCYIFADELGKNYMYTKDLDIKIKNFSFNTKAFQEMGGDYLLSAVKIMNAEENGLLLEKTFHSPESPWKIYLYRANYRAVNGGAL